MLTTLADTASTVTNDLAPLTPWINGGVGAMVVGVVLYLVPKVLSHIESQRVGFQDTLNKQVDAQREERREFIAAIERNTAVMNSLNQNVQQQLRA